jgi:hypothetical protein
MLILNLQYFGGRGAKSSKAGGGGSANASKSGTRESISGKPFDANDFTTWTKGTEVEFDASDDTFGWYSRQMSGQKWDSGVVKEVHDDHLIVDVPAVSDHMWLDADNAELYRVKKRR